MLDMTQLDKENVWKIVKEIRISSISSLLIKNIDIECQGQNNLLRNENIRSNIDNLEKGLNLNMTDTKIPKENITEEIFQTAVEMYTYLNFCPKDLNLNLFSFASKSFEMDSPKQIVLGTLSRM